MSGLDYERVVLSGIGIGIMHSHPRHIMPYMHERKQFGEPIGNFPADARQDRRYLRRDELGTRLCLRSRQGLRPREVTRQDAAACVLYASEKAMEMSVQGVQAWAGQGTSTTRP